VALLIDRPPEIVVFAVDGEKDLIQVPRVAGPGPPTPELIGIRLAELLAPLADGFVRDDHKAGQHILYAGGEFRRLARARRVP
jgi:hypothetical protein